MDRSTASILTKSQRERIREEFESLDPGQTRRDRGRVRDRLEAGVFDFRLLADYPDEEFELAFEDVDDESLRAALVDLYVTAERLRELRDYDREAVITDVRSRADALATEETGTLKDVDLTPPPELRRQTEQRVTERLEPNRWDRRADRSLRVALVALVPLVGIGVADAYTADNLLHTLAPVYVLFLLLVLAGFAGLGLIRGAQILKYEIIPFCRRVRRNPGSVVADVRRVARKPGRRLREAWDTL